MAEVAMAREWSVDQKLFPRQFGFTCPPFDYDAALSNFLRMCSEMIGLHGGILQVPDYAHGLDQRECNVGTLENCVPCTASNGVDVRGQRVEGIRRHCVDLSDREVTNFHMASYAIVEAEGVDQNFKYYDNQAEYGNGNSIPTSKGYFDFIISEYFEVPAQIIPGIARWK